MLKDNSYKSEFYQNCGDSYDYLAIGNSITWHRICDYWWNENGMAATKKENDYYHLVLKGLDERYEKINSEVINFIQWETLSYDRSETLSLIDNYLSNKIDLITIQLGENVTDTSTFESDLLYFVQYVKEKAPETQIIIIGNTWKNDIIENAKMNVAKLEKVDYIDLKEIQDNEEYRNKLGDIVYDKDGNSHAINYDAVAAHPNDKAMSYIAEKLLEKIK